MATRATNPAIPRAGPDTPTDIMRQFAAAISGMRPAELQGVLREPMAAAAPDAHPPQRVAPPSRRRPRLADVVTYRVPVST